MIDMYEIVRVACRGIRFRGRRGVAEPGLPAVVRFREYADLRGARPGRGRL